MYAVYDQLDDPEEVAKVGILGSCEFDNACELPDESLFVEAQNRRQRLPELQKVPAGLAAQPVTPRSPNAASLRVKVR